MKIAELIVEALVTEGVEYIFGVPGEENQDFLFALENSSIKFIPVRHEQGGAFIANIMGRLTGKAGVCMSTLGPGATNLMTGIADAYLDKSPVVAITGQGNIDRLHHESHQYIDVINMLKPITKWNSSIRHPKTTTEIIRKAFMVAQEEKPGATHIEIPEDIAGLNIDDPPAIIKPATIRRPSPDSKSVVEAMSLIKQAKKLLIIAGNGAIRSRASEALQHFSKLFNIPVVTTFMGKGSIPSYQKQHVGTIGLGFEDYPIEACYKADCIISVGYDIAEYNPEMWNKNNDKTIIHVDFTSAETYTNYSPEVQIVGDIAACIKIMSHSDHIESYDDWYIPIKKRFTNDLDSYQADPDSKTFDAPGVIHLVRSALPNDGLVISDVGSHKMWIARNYQTNCPNGCIISNGLASMGIALPGGIGAKLVSEDRPVVCIMGDGGAMMNIQELETAVRLGTGFTIIILNDNNYGLIEWKQEMEENKSFGTKINNPDFVALAKSFGIEAHKPKNYKSFKILLEKSIQNNSLNLFEIPIVTDVNKKLIKKLNNYFKTS